MWSILVPSLLLLPYASIAFVVTNPDTTRKFSPARPTWATRSSRLYAETGAPKYDKLDAVLKEAEVVGEGSVMLHIDVLDQNNMKMLDYQPGHVVGLEILKSDGDVIADEKTAKDVKENQGWLRGPYTLSRANTDTGSVDIMIKVVGTKSQKLASAPSGTPLKIGGKFHVPIVEGLSKHAKRIVLVSTGVGIGPCIGAIEQMLASNDESIQHAKIDLYASFRTEQEMPYRTYLDDLMQQHSKQFQWTPVVTSDTGRLSASEESLRKVATCHGDDICCIQDTHYHLIGNGVMVQEWKAGLSKAGVADERITIETYFNHRSETSQETIDRIASVFATSSASVPAK